MHLSNSGTYTRRLRTNGLRYLTIGIASAATLLSSASVSSAAPEPDPGESARYCVLLVGKAAAGRTSPVEGRACSNKSDAAAQEAAEAQAVAAGYRSSQTAGATSNRTLLMEYFEHINFGGTQFKVYGSYGSCDYAGYIFYPDTGWYSWGDVMSSVKGYGNCNWAKFTHQNGTTVKSYWLSTYDLGPVNDNVGRINVANR